MLIRSGLPRNKVTAVDGGYAERVIQVWIMRPGASFDQGPFIYSNRLRATGRGQFAPGLRSSVGLLVKPVSGKAQINTCSEIQRLGSSETFEDDTINRVMRRIDEGVSVFNLNA